MALDYKAELLGAIAAGGSRAAAQYQQSLAQLQTANQDAVRAALANSVAQSVPTEGQAQLSQTISQPYQNQSANLMAQQANSGDFFNRLSASAGTFMDQAGALVPALEKRYELELANKMAMAEWEAANSGSGRSGSGSGNGETNDFLALSKSLGGKENVKDYFSGFGDKYTARTKAIEAGIPEQIANSWFTPYASGDEEYSDLAAGDVQRYLQGNLVYTNARGNDVKAKNLRQLRRDLAIGAAQIPGNQHAIRKALIQQAKTASRKTKRKNKRG